MTPGWRRSCACLLAGVLAVATAIGAHAADPQPASRQKAKPRAHPLEPALRHARTSSAAAAKLKGYEAAFYKRDMVNGTMHVHKTQVKFRTKPMSVYMKFKAPHEGREVIYVHGRNDGNLLAHETGFKSILGTISLAPSSPTALSESRHPITEMGMLKLVDGVIAQWEAEKKFGEIEVKIYPEVTDRKKELGPGKFMVIESSHPRPRRQFAFHVTRLWIDQETNLPVRVQQWGFPKTPGGSPPLIEEYTYGAVRVSTGLKDIDFDVNNPRYGF